MSTLRWWIRIWRIGSSVGEYNKLGIKIVLLASPAPKYPSRSCSSHGSAPHPTACRCGTSPCRTRYSKNSASRSPPSSHATAHLYYPTTTIILRPVQLIILKSLVVETAQQLIGCIVVDLAPPMELVVMPLALIGDAAVIVEQLSESIHGIFLPLALVVASVLVVEGAFAVSLVVVDESAILASIFVL